jgi:hypothetical protein
MSALGILRTDQYQVNVAGFTDFSDSATQLKAIHFRHHPIADDHIDGRAANGFPSAASIGGLMHGMAPRTQA